jgi:GT2 family glycosyltransferase
MENIRLVCIIVLAWNHLEDTMECLESMMKSDYDPVRILLLDNGSVDGTSDFVRKHFPKVDILRSEINLGISGGYNLGMKYALEQGSDYVLIANNDIVVDMQMVHHLVDDLEYNPKAGISMPKIYHYYGDRNRLWCTGARWRRFPPSVKMTDVNANDSEKFSQPFEIEFAPSCCLLLRRRLIEQIGYFDAEYFFYNDDWDYSIRCRKAGYSLRYVPTAKMWHKVSASTQKSDKPAEWWNYLGRSTVRFYKTYKHSWQLTSFIIWFVIREIFKGNVNRILPFLAGISDERNKYIQTTL